MAQGAGTKIDNLAEVLNDSVLEWIG